MTTSRARSFAAPDPELAYLDEQTASKVYEIPSLEGTLYVLPDSFLTYKGLTLVGRDTAAWNEPIQKNFVHLADIMTSISDRVSVIEANGGGSGGGNVPTPFTPTVVEAQMDYARTVTIVGTAEPTVEILCYIGDTPKSLTVSDSQGNWTITFPTVEDLLEVTIKARRLSEFSPATDVIEIAYPEEEIEPPVTDKLLIPNGVNKMTAYVNISDIDSKAARSAIGVLFRDGNNMITATVLIPDTNSLDNDKLLVDVPASATRIEFFIAYGAADYSVLKHGQSLRVEQTSQGTYQLKDLISGELIRTSVLNSAIMTTDATLNPDDKAVVAYNEETGRWDVKDQTVTRNELSFTVYALGYHGDKQDPEDTATGSDTTEGVDKSDTDNIDSDTVDFLSGADIIKVGSASQQLVYGGLGSDEFYLVSGCSSTVVSSPQAAYEASRDFVKAEAGSDATVICGGNDITCVQVMPEATVRIRNFKVGRDLLDLMNLDYAVHPTNFYESVRNLSRLFKVSYNSSSDVITLTGKEPGAPTIILESMDISINSGYFGNSTKKNSYKLLRNLTRFYSLSLEHPSELLSRDDRFLVYSGDIEDYEIEHLGSNYFMVTQPNLVSAYHLVQVFHRDEWEYITFRDVFLNKDEVTNAFVLDSKKLPEEPSILIGLDSHDSSPRLEGSTLVLDTNLVQDGVNIASLYVYSPTYFYLLMSDSNGQITSYILCNYVTSIRFNDKEVNPLNSEDFV